MGWERGWKWMFEWVGRRGGNGCLSGWGDGVEMDV